MLDATTLVLAHSSFRLRHAVRTRAPCPKVSEIYNRSPYEGCLDTVVDVGRDTVEARGSFGSACPWRIGPIEAAGPQIHLRQRPGSGGERKITKSTTLQSQCTHYWVLPHREFTEATSNRGGSDGLQPSELARRSNLRGLMAWLPGHCGN